MRRKIIKQGRNTLTVTLPNKWVKDYNIQAGNEVEMSEKGNTLTISTEKRNEESKTEIDVSGLNIHYIWKYLMAVYREGYDEIKIKFKPDEVCGNPFKYVVGYAVDTRYNKKGEEKKKPMEAIQKMMSRFIGFEIIDQRQDYCIIRDMAQISTKEFDNSLRRIFLLIQQMGEEVYESLKNNDLEKAESIHDIDINVDKFHDFCIRVLNKTGFKEVKKSHLIFAMLYLLELFGDEYKHISFHLINETNKNKVNPIIAECCSKVNIMFNAFYELHYNFTKEKAEELATMDTEMFYYFPDVYKKLEKTKGHLIWVETELANHLKRMVRYLDALTELRLELEV